MSRSAFGYVTVSSTFGNFGKFTRSTPSIRTKSSATTPSSRCAPGLRISRNSSSCGSSGFRHGRSSSRRRLADRPVQRSRSASATTPRTLVPWPRRRPCRSSPYSAAQRAHHRRRARSLRRERSRRDVAADDRRRDRRDEGAPSTTSSTTKDEIVLAAAEAELARLDGGHRRGRGASVAGSGRATSCSPASSTSRSSDAAR